MATTSLYPVPIKPAMLNRSDFSFGAYQTAREGEGGSPGEAQITPSVTLNSSVELVLDWEVLVSVLTENLTDWRDPRLILLNPVLGELLPPNESAPSASRPSSPPLQCPLSLRCSHPLPSLSVFSASLSCLGA